MRIRVRDRDGVCTLSLADTATFKDLVALYAKERNLSPDALHLDFKTGYPAPKPISLNPEDPLVPVVRNGDQVLVSEKAGPSPPAAKSDSTPSSTTTANRPAPATTKASTRGMVATGGMVESVDEDAVKVAEGFLIRREVADDNSCLFASISYVLTRNTIEPSTLRQMAAGVIRSDPVNYSDAILGLPVDSYCKKLLNANSWGGAIELKIFSDYFKTEICSVDVQTTRVDRFGEGLYQERAFVLYSGIHYDALAVTPHPSLPQDQDQTVFGTDDIMLYAAVEIAQKLNKKRQFTDLAGFTLRCDVCKRGLKGQKEAQSHAQGTGHTRFVEYS